MPKCHRSPLHTPNTIDEWAALAGSVAATLRAFFILPGKTSRLESAATLGCVLTGGCRTAGMIHPDIPAPENNRRAAEATALCAGILSAKAIAGAAAPLQKTCAGLAFFSSALRTWAAHHPGHQHEAKAHTLANGAMNLCLTAGLPAYNKRTTAAQIGAVCANVTPPICKTAEKLQDAFRPEKPGCESPASKYVSGFLAEIAEIKDWQPSTGLRR